MGRFVKGKTYESTCWFTGGHHVYYCTDRDQNHVIFRSVYDESDGTHDAGTETFLIHKDGKREYVVMQTYRGEENRMYA